MAYAVKMSRSNRKLAAVLAADVVDYSRHMAVAEAHTLELLRWLRKDVLEPAIAGNGGDLIKSMGDGWLVEFASVRDAIGCAIGVQRRLAGHDNLKLRIGVHIGDIVHEDDDIYGDGVNIAARLQQITQPGGITISDICHQSIDEQAGSEFVQLGARSLKNIPSAILVYGWRGTTGKIAPSVPHGGPGEWTNTEALIVTLARSGDRDAFGELVRRRQSWVRNLMRRSCGNAELANDLSQQVFLTAWRKIGQLRNPEKFSVWLRRLAIHTWLQHARRNGALGKTVEIRDSDLVQRETSGAAIDLDRALASLPDVVRLCIVLSHGEGMTQEEIADHTGLPLGTVKSHIRRGVQRLQDFLSDYRNTPDPETAND